MTVNATTGTVTLPGTNSYSNGTKLTSGTLAVANNSALGGGAVTLSGGTLQLQLVPSIGINFPGNLNNGADSLPAAMAAGTCRKPTGTMLLPAARGLLHDANAVNTGAAVAFTTGGVGPWDVSETTGTNPNTLNGDQLLNNGGIYGGTINTTVSGVSYPTGFRVFVHLLTDHGAGSVGHAHADGWDRLARGLRRHSGHTECHGIRRWKFLWVHLHTSDRH